jgi:hypothetical protein
MSASNANRKSTRWSLLALGLLWVAASALGMGEERRLQVTLYDYASAFRWGEMNQILTFFDRDKDATPAPTTFDLERWKQWRVVGYRAQPFAMSKDGHAEQVVEIEITNVNTQSTRKIMDRQRWRYDRKAKVWLLTSGLPRLGQS